MPTHTPIHMQTPTPNSFSRRATLGLIAGALGVAVRPGSARALDAQGARVLVDKVVADINAVISSGRSESQMFRDFERIFARYADVPTIARYALGVDARRASARQLSEFTEVFARYMAVKYGKRFREFIGGRIEVDRARQVKSFYEVRTTAHLRGEAPFAVTFLVSDRSGEDKFFNMFIEGINMLLTERSEVGAMLDSRGGDIDRMIADLRKVG